MKYFSDVQALSKEINSYVEHFVGLPLLVGLDHSEDYRELLEMLMLDPGKQIVRISESCSAEFPPDPIYLISSVSNSAKTAPVVWIGAAQSIMLYGQKNMQQFFVTISGTTVKGPVILLCPFCCSVLESIGRSYVKLGMNIITLPSKDRDIPSICVHSDASSCTAPKYANGIKSLLRTLEIGKSIQTIHVITSCDKKHLVSSVYPYVESVSVYQALCQKEPGLSTSTTEVNGTEQQWQNLAKQVAEFGSLAELCEKKLCSVKQLPAEFPDYMIGANDERFLCFIALKAFCGAGNDYLGACLRKCQSPDDLLRCLYETILDISPDDPKLSTLLRQRSRLLQGFEENSTLLKDYCDKATIYGKNVLRYLSDDTEEERAALIHALCTYEYTPAEITALLKETASELSLYLRKFTFDAFNTKLMESDTYLREMLTTYFQRYKLQKLTNHQDQDFIACVEEEAHKRSFTKLPARSSIVKKLDKKDAQPFFFDALGVEFLSYIEAKADQYGMQFECQIGHCNLPSITSKNKEFYGSFPADSILKEDGIDKIKHNGTKYDFRFTTEPLHLFDELAILDRDLKKMSDILAAETAKKIIILSDNGASRLAVTYQSENDKLVLEEAGQHSGRCCPVADDPHIPFVSYEDGFAVLANYERFKGSRKADVETHGGASLEEVIVPVIILTAKPREQQMRFPETSVKCSAKDGSTILLYANPPLHEPRMVVDDNSYVGTFEGDKHNVRFTMPDIRRKGRYDAVIYDGTKKLATLPFETKRSTGTNELF